MRVVQGGRQRQRNDASMAAEQEREPAHSAKVERISDRAARSSTRPDQSVLDARVSSHDDAGHSKRWNIDVPPNFHAQIQRFVEQGNYNFDSTGSFIRTAALWAMDFLERLAPPRYVSNTQVLKAIATENASSETRRQYLESLERTSKEVYELLGLGMKDAAERHVAKVLEHIRQLPKSDEWRQLYEATFKQRFGHVLKRGKISSLTSLSYGADDDDQD